VLNQPLAIEISSSLQKQLLVYLPHAISVIIFVWLSRSTSIPLIVIALMMVGAGLSVYYFHRLHISNTLQRSVKLISKDASSNWQIVLSNNNTERVSLDNTCYRSNFLIILNFNDVAKNNYTALITPDSVTTEEYRKLMVLLRIHRNREG